MKPLLLALLALLITPIVVLAAQPEGRGPGGGDGPPPEIPIIVVDPGHGGTDTGSTECQGLTEAKANLDISLRLEVILEATNTYDVRLTRTDNSTLSNNDRYTFANSVDGNALVSIHLNGSTDHSVNGTQGFWGKKNKDEAFTNTVHLALANNLGISNRGVTNFPSGVLLKSNMPATLQETVFISNTTECQLLKDGTGNRQQQIAEALAQGVRSWFAK